MRRLICLLAVGLLITAQAALAAGEIQLDVKEKTLSNGMRILVVENHIAPVMSTYIRFKVGAVDEHNGITGISHFLEHMLFKGTRIFGTSNYEAEVPLMKKIDSLGVLLEAEKAKLRSPLRGGSEERAKALREEIAAVQAEQAKYIIKDELWETYLKNGGNGLNASTGNDGTQYFLSLPSNRLELWAFMESDRMANLVFREFYSERDVIREERRLTTENQPMRTLSEALNATACWASPYHWSVVGWASDIENYRLADMQEYFHTYYHPSNAIAVVVGDVKPEEVFAVCEKYFGAIPARPTPRQVFTEDAPQKGERRVEVEYDAKPSALIGWHMPGIGHPDVAALDVLSDILSKGRTSRLYKNIMEKKLGRVSAGISMSRYPELFTCNITPMGQHSVDEVMEATLAEIDRLKTEPVQAWEIDKVRTQADADFVRSLSSNIGLAFQLGNMEAMAGNWHYLIDYRDEYKKVTPEDILRVANQYFTKSNRTIATLVSADGAKPAGGPGRPGGPGDRPGK
ncbi:MAG: insulinase family protein [candidate division Zixibacteria bacterium]|nr:insulinase family protein [candidate division Zixibacteria bacterium]